MAKFTFTRLHETNPARAYWLNEDTGAEHIYACPKALRPQCAHEQDGKRCPQRAAKNRLHCDNHAPRAE